MSPVIVDWYLQRGRSSPDSIDSIDVIERHAIDEKVEQLPFDLAVMVGEKELELEPI
jgi:hypothetical protein